MKIIVVKPATRFTIVVSKTVSPKAVRRNLIRRRIREAVHSFSTSPKLTIIALPSILGKTFQEIKAEIQQITKNL